MDVIIHIPVPASDMFAQHSDNELWELHKLLHSGWNSSGHSATAQEIEDVLVLIEDESADRGWDIFVRLHREAPHAGIHGS